MKTSFRSLLERDQHRVILWSMGALATFVVSIAAAWVKSIKPGDAWLFANSSVAVWMPALILPSVVVLIAGYFTNKKIVDLREKLNQALSDNDALSSYVEELKEKQFVDPITGIPNNFLWEKHLTKIINQTKKESFQAMIIDLVGFQNINRTFTPSKADKILRKIAQDLRGGMRRNEQMYRRRRMATPLNGEAGFLDHDIYRKYPGGDEFYIYIKGGEVDAIGLLTRFQRQLRTKISEEISMSIIHTPIELLFYGAVCPIYSDDSVEAVATRLDDLLSKAKYDDHSRLVCYSFLSYEDAEYSDSERRVREEADREFGGAT